MQKISIGDIAEKLGVSKTTVSFVLNDKGDEKNISKKTQERILNLVKELDYQPSYVARSLKKGKTNTIGYLVPDIANPFFAKIGRKIEDILANQGYQLLIGSTDENPEKEATLINTFLSRQVDGLVIAASKLDSKPIINMCSNNFPLVLFDREDKNVDANYIIVENKSSMCSAVEELIISGRKKIGLLSLTPYVYPLKLRMEGYKEALKNNNIPIDNDIIRTIDYADVKSSMQEQIKIILNKGVDSIVFTNNLIAAEAIWLLNVHFKEYISKLKLVSFDNIELFDYSNPRVTSLAQPIDDIAVNIVELLLSNINEEETTVKRIVLEPILIKRN